jgi:signal transduction histidine kinase
MMFSSLRFRLWLTYFLVVGVVIFVAGATLAVYLVRNPAVDRREVQRLRVVSNLILQRSQVFNMQPDLVATPRLEDAAQRADTLLGVRVAIFNSNGQLVVDSRSRSVAPLPGLNFFKTQRLRAIPVFRDQNGLQWLYILSPVEGGNALLVAVPRLRLPLLTILRDEFLPPFLRASAVALVLSLLMAIVIARWISAPLQRLASAARSVSAGHFPVIPLEGPGEVQEVARAFNEMGERVQASQRSQRDFVANVSHDLKTPLTSIQGFAQAILDGTASEPEASRQAAQVIFDEASRMHHMVIDLLDLARIDAGMLSFDRQPVALDKLLESVVQKFTPQAHQANVDLALHLPGDNAVARDLIVTGDVDRLAQVFSNLVDNALKFTPAFGQIRVSLRPVDGWLETSVADGGPGIPAGEEQRIFERFYQVDKSRRGDRRRGVGLGLAIAREITQAHGGKIAAYNRNPVEAHALRPANDMPPADQANLSTPSPSALEGPPGHATGSVFVVWLPIPRPEKQPEAGRPKGAARGVGPDPDHIVKS